MFKLAEKRTVVWPIWIPVPQDGGKVKRYEAKVEFEKIDQDEFDAIYSNGGIDVDMLNRVVIGWPEGQFQDERGENIPPTDEGKERLFKITYVRNAFVAGYLQVMQGREAGRKN